MWNSHYLIRLPFLEDCRQMSTCIERNACMVRPKSGLCGRVSAHTLWPRLLDDDGRGRAFPRLSSPRKESKETWWQCKAMHACKQD